MTEDLQLSVGIGGEKAFMAAIGQMSNAVNQLTGKIDTLGNEGEQTGQQVTKAGISMGDAFRMAGVSMGLDAIVQGIKEIGMTAFNSAVQYESLGIQLGVLLGDASKVPAVLDDWKKFSDATPFEPDQVNKAGRALLAFGFQTEELIPLMTKIGDVSAGTGKDFNELVTIYGKARTAGKVMGDDLRQLAEAGLPILPELAKQLGVSVAEVAKAGSEGKITFEVFQNAFAGLAAEGGKFGGMMEKLSLSSEGLISTMKGELEGSLRRLGEQIVPVVIGAMQTLLPVVQGVISIFTDYPEILIAATGAFVAYNAQTIAATSYQVALKVATYASEVATKLLNATLNLTPWGIALLGVTALVTALVAFRDKTEEVSKAQQYTADVTEKINEAYAKESAQVNILFDKLSKLNPKSDEARKIRDEINTTYKDYLPNQLTEASNNDEIKRSQDAVNDSLRKKIALQVQEQEMVRIYTEQQKVLIGGYAEVKKAVKVTATDFQKAVTSIQTAMGKMSAEQREGLFGKALNERLIDGIDNSLVNLINSTAMFANVGGDVRKTLDAIIAGGFDSQNAFILSALATAQSEDQLRILTDLINKETAPAVNDLGGVTGKTKEEIAAAAKAAKEAAKALKQQQEALDRIRFKPQIMLEFQDAPTQADLDKIFGVSYEEAQKRANDYANFVDKVIFQNERLEQHTGGTTLQMATFWERMATKVGQDAADSLRESIERLKGSFVDFGVQAAQSIGFAIGAGKSAGDAFKKVIASMMVEVPKLAGMALLNAAVAAGPTPAGLAMAVAGLALIGLSGLVGGIQSKNAAEQSAMNTELNNLPQGATGAPGATSMGGLGGFSAGQQQQPIMVNLNAEMDGVQLGGLFRRVTTNYNKTAIRNQ